MKVLFIHTTYRHAGGEDAVVSAEIELLRRNGVEVQLLCFSNVGNTLFKLLQLPFNVTSYLRTIRHIRRFRPDVIHVHNLHFAASPSVLHAAKKESVPVVYTLHNFRLICPSALLFHKGDLFLDSIHRSFPWKAVRKGVYKNSRSLTFWLAFSNYLHRKCGTWNICDRYIVLNEQAAELLARSVLKIPAAKITVKANFIPTPTPVVPPERNGHFLFVGRLSEEKGIDLMLRAFSYGQHSLKIAGDGPLREKVQLAAQKNPRLQWLGSRGREEVATLMDQCSALVFPSIWYEGMPMTIIEAFSRGTPVIAPKMGAMESMVTNGRNGSHFIPSNPDDLHEKLSEWMLLNEQEKQQYRQHAFESFQTSYTSQQSLRSLLNIYQNVVYEKK